MSKARVLTVVIALGTAAAVVGVTMGDRDGPTIRSIGSPHCDPDPAFGPVAASGPAGEWWAKGPGFLLRARLQAGRGHVAVSRNGSRYLFDMQVYYPDLEIDLRRIYYEVSSSGHTSHWHGTIPQFQDWRPGATPEETKPGDEDIHRMVIEYVYGTFGTDLAPFTMHLASRHDPRDTCSDRELHTLSELEEMLP